MRGMLAGAMLMIASTESWARAKPEPSAPVAYFVMNADGDTLTVSADYVGRAYPSPSMVTSSARTMRESPQSKSTRSSVRPMFSIV